MPLKIISWNCNMAFRKKYEKVLALQPDLLVLQECENEAKLERLAGDLGYNELIWYGDNPHKGVAVMSFNEAHVKRSDLHHPEYRYILPLHLEALGQEIHLFCIWAMPHPTERKKDYVGQVWGAIQHYSELLDSPSILVGDFNSNAIWDTKRKQGNHSHVVDFLSKKKIHSLYHEQTGCAHGQEKDPTLYLLKNAAKPYHMDYCFVSESLYTEQTRISIGSREEWISLSDHMPVVVEGLGS